MSDNNQSIPPKRSQWVLVGAVSAGLVVGGLYLRLTNERLFDLIVSRQLETLLRSSVEIVLIVTLSLGVLLWKLRDKARSFISLLVSTAVGQNSERRVVYLRYFGVAVIALVLGVLLGRSVDVSETLEVSTIVECRDAKMIRRFEFLVDKENQRVWRRDWIADPIKPDKLIPAFLGQYNSSECRILGDSDWTCGDYASRNMTSVINGAVQWVGIGQGCKAFHNGREVELFEF
jgi:hypothetical protein